jgi:hypothetical protein
MAVVDVLRPVSVRKAGAGVAVPSGTLAAVTSDNSDATYIQLPSAGSGNNWNLRVGSHTPSAGYQRHQIRGRIRIRTDTGTAFEDIDVGRGVNDYIDYATGVPITDTIQEISTSWFQSAGYGLATAGALADLNIGGGWMVGQVGATELRTAECYIDIDCRLGPQYSAEVRDSAGADQSGGTVADTTQPTLFFGAVDYDGLPAASWSVDVRDIADNSVFSSSGSGAPPVSTTVSSSLANGAYTVLFSVTSTIRGADAFTVEDTISFTLENTVPPPSPPLITVTEDSGGYLVSWENPGGQLWDNDYVVTEVWRDDCNGSFRIATIPDGLNGSYLDLAIPQLDPIPSGPDCEESSLACDITYRVRYLGYISTTVELPDTIPADMILGWPSTVGTIPSGWTRVTSLDGVFPRGASGTGAPVATGGTTSHTHTTPNHGHQIGAHSHSVGGSTGSSNSSTTSARFNGASQPQADQPHTHTRPSSTGSAAAVFTGAEDPGTGSANNTPPALDVIWIQSDGSQANYPDGCVGWATESVSGWDTYAAALGRYLKGAAAAGNGGATSGSATHTHTVSSHSHTGSTHDHSLGSTWLSNPSSSQEAGDGSSTPRWLPRHTHPMDVGSASTGNTGSGTGGTTGSATLEPPHRRLRVLENTGGGTQTRIIGLYTGAVADLDPLLTLCDGSNGTPDMRTYFARDTGSDSVNSTGGSSTHTHSVPNHTHTMGSHSHTTNVLASTSTSYEAPSFGDLGDSPTVSHDHSSGNTGSTTPSLTSNGAGTSGSGSHIPPYKEVHFVRLDGTISGGPLPVPELKVSEFSSTTVPALTHGDDMDRLASLDTVLAVVTDRSSIFPRLVADSIPLDGGLHSVSTTEPGEDLTLSMAVEGLPAIEALEELLASDLVYWSPLGGTSGWFAPGGWTVNRVAPGTWVVQVTMVNQTWPSTDDPEEYL